MKKILILMICILAGTSAFAKKVMFAVDMDTFTVSPNGVHVTGDFQALAGYPGGDWTSNETVCTQQGASTIYSVVVDIPAFAKYEYKFVNGDQFYEVEFVPIESRVGYDFVDNRWLWVDSLANDTTFVGAVKFAGNAPAGLKLVRFMVDLNNQTTISTRPHVIGNFQNWNPTTTSLYSFGDSVFEIISYLDTGNYQFKFVNGDSVSLAESIPFACNFSGNRSITVSKDTILSAFCFASCTVCNPLSVEAKNLDEQFTMYPNPASSFVTFELKNQTNSTSIILCDLAGRIVKSYPAQSQITFDKNELNSGLYIVKLLSHNFTLSTHKLVIE